MRNSRRFLIGGLFLTAASILLLSCQRNHALGPMYSAGASESAYVEELAPFVPTPMRVVERMLDLAEIKKGDVLYDLGSGDGRIVIAAAKKYGIKAVGIDFDPELVQKSRARAKEEGVDHLVEFREQDIMTADISPATVVTIYLMPESNMLLRPILWSKLRPGARVVSNEFDMEDWEPVNFDFVNDVEGDDYTIYVWRITGREADLYYR